MTIMPQLLPSTQIKLVQMTSNFAYFMRNWLILVTNIANDIMHRWGINFNKMWSYLKWKINEYFILIFLTKNFFIHRLWSHSRNTSCGLHGVHSSVPSHLFTIFLNMLTNISAKLLQEQRGRHSSCWNAYAETKTSIKIIRSTYIVNKT